MKYLLSRISFKGVLIGALVDVIGTNIWAFFMIMYIVFAYNLTSFTEEALMSKFVQIGNENILLNILNMLIGGGFVVLGGYIASRIAKKYILLNATLASFLCVLFTIPAFFSSEAKGQLWLLVVTLFLNPILALLGGYIYLWTTGIKSNAKKTHK